MRKIILLILIILFSISASAIPETLNLQGKLTNSEGTVLTGAHTLSARIYDNSTIGSILWEENHSLSLGSTGVYDIILGGLSSLNILDFDVPYYMALKVDSDSEMTPRINMTAVPYAFMAKTAGNISSLNLTIGDSIIVDNIYPNNLGNINLDNITILQDLRVLGNSYLGNDLIIGSNNISSSYFGIGTTSPLSLLDIYGGNLTITNGSETNYPYLHFSPGGYIYDNGTAVVIGHN